MNQGSISSAEANTSNSTVVVFGNSAIDTSVFTAHFDDLYITRSTADYPIGDMKVYGLTPDGLGTSFSSGNFKNNDGTAIDATTPTRVDEVPMNSQSDYIQQAFANSGTYIELTFGDATQTCIKGVRATVGIRKAASQTDTGTTNIISGATTTTVYTGDHLGTAISWKSATVTPGAVTWDQTQLNALTARVGYSTDVSPVPYWDGLMLEYAVPASSLSGPPPTPGSESGQTTSVVTATGSPVCGSPSQTDSRACSYGTESYAVSPAPIISTTLSLAGSGAGTCQLYQFTPNTSAGTTSVYADRGPGSGGIGVVTDSITRYSGAFTFGQLCSTAAGGPAGWPGYYLKYDAGAAACTAFAEAGKGSLAPSYATAGTISFYNGSGVTSFAQPASGTWASQPATVAAFTSGGFKYDLTATVASVPSYTSQLPTGASGTADRTMGRSVQGAPIIGTITYKVTNASTSAVVADLVITIDLGTLTAYARQG